MKPRLSTIHFMLIVYIICTIGLGLTIVQQHRDHLLVVKDLNAKIAMLQQELLDCKRNIPMPAILEDRDRK